MPVDRPNVVLLHGALGFGDDWRAVEGALAPSCRVFVPDLLGGIAAPPVPDTARYGVAVEAASMLERIAARLVTRARVHLVGHDYGGVVALEMARQRPGAVAGLVLYEPTRFDLLTDPFDREFVQSVRRSVGMLVARGFGAGAARMFHDFWHGPGRFDALDEAARDRLARAAPKLVLELQAMAEAPPGPSGDETRRIPATLVGGLRSFLITRRVLERLAGSLRHASLEWIDGDHHSPIEDPRPFVEVLRRALPGLARAAA